MAEAQLNLNVAVGGVAKASAELGKAQRAVKQLADADEKAFQQFLKHERATAQAKPAGAIRGIKDMLGEESTAGQLLKMVRGAGAFAAVGMGVQLVGSAVRNVSEATKEWAKGTIDAQAAIMRMAEGVPVLGQLVTAARNLGEAISAVSPASREAARMEQVRAAAAERFRREAKQAQESAVREGRADDLVSGLTGGGSNRNMTARQRAYSDLNSSLDPINKAVSTIRDQMRSEFGDMTAESIRQWRGESGLAEYRRQQDRIASLNAEANRRIAETQDTVAGIDRDELQKSNDLNSKIWNAIRGAGGEAVNALKRGARTAGGAVQSAASFLANRNGRPAADPSEFEFAPSPLSPFFSGGMSLARTAAMERAEGGISEGERKMIELLTTIDAKLLMADDTYR